MDIDELSEEQLARKQAAKVHFGADDIAIGGWRLNAVHQIPEDLDEDQELDFYLDTGTDIYLLRLQNRPDNTIQFVPGNPSDSTSVTYIIVRKRLTSDISTQLAAVFAGLKALAFPAYHTAAFHSWWA